jgi:hypothetical protein
MTLGIRTFGIAPLSIMTHSIPTLSIMTLGITMLSLMILGTMTIIFMAHFIITYKNNDTRHKDSWYNTT